ncbi:DHHA2 domain-containing protein, putative [Babesia caballi]|uniref:DHHA2 domain-containing protein, putative n=1 Tax=Babesia caballi TaxID=5871 RepID=A0AAV4LS72_BABCB|nr:DHHA2 domain-containing protein, putative [Babesia caballi]
MTRRQKARTPLDHRHHGTLVEGDRVGHVLLEQGENQQVAVLGAGNAPAAAEARVAGADRERRVRVVHSVAVGDFADLASGTLVDAVHDRDVPAADVGDDAGRNLGRRRGHEVHEGDGAARNLLARRKLKVQIGLRLVHANQTALVARDAVEPRVIEDETAQLALGADLLHHGALVVVDDANGGARVGADDQPRKRVVEDLDQQPGLDVPGANGGVHGGSHQLVGVAHGEAHAGDGHVVVREGEGLHDGDLLVHGVRSLLVERVRVERQKLSVGAEAVVQVDGAVAAPDGEDNVGVARLFGAEGHAGHGGGVLVHASPEVAELLVKKRQSAAVRAAAGTGPVARSGRALVPLALDERGHLLHKLHQVSHAHVEQLVLDGELLRLREVADKRPRTLQDDVVVLHQADAGLLGVHQGLQQPHDGLGVHEGLLLAGVEADGNHVGVAEDGASLVGVEVGPWDLHDGDLAVGRHGELERDRRHLPPLLAGRVGVAEQVQVLVVAVLYQRHLQQPGLAAAGGAAEHNVRALRDGLGAHPTRRVRRVGALELVRRRALAGGGAEATRQEAAQPVGLAAGGGLLADKLLDHAQVCLGLLSGNLGVVDALREGVALPGQPLDLGAQLLDGALHSGELRGGLQHPRLGVGAHGLLPLEILLERLGALYHVAQVLGLHAQRAQGAAREDGAPPQLRLDGCAAQGQVVAAAAVAAPGALDPRGHGVDVPLLGEDAGADGAPERLEAGHGRAELAKAPALAVHAANGALASQGVDAVADPDLEGANAPHDLAVAPPLDDAADSRLDHHAAAVAQALHREADLLVRLVLHEDQSLPNGEGSLGGGPLRHVAPNENVEHELALPALVLDGLGGADLAGLQQVPEAVEELRVREAHRVAGAGDLDDLEHAAAAELRVDGHAVKVVGAALGAGLDAANEVGGGGADLGHERVELAGELRADGLLPGHAAAAPAVGGALLLNVRLEDLAHLVDLGREDEGDRVKAVDLVLHGAGEVVHDEAALVELDLGEASVVGVALDDLVAERLVLAAGQVALLVDHHEQPVGAALEELDAVGVVGEVEGVPGDALGGVELLLAAEDEVVEEVLQRLVGEVDAELLEGVVLEALEAEDVQDAGGQRGVGHVADGLVDAPHDVVEEHAVHVLGDGVADVARLLHAQRLGVHLVRGLDGAGHEGVHERDAVHVEERGHLMAVAGLHVADGGAFAALLLDELDVAKVQDGGDDVEDDGDLPVGEADGAHGGERGLEVGHVEAALAVCGNDAEVAAEGAEVKLPRRVAAGVERALLPVGEVLAPVGGRGDLVEDVVVALALLLLADADLFQQVGLDARADEARLDRALLAVLQLDELAEAGAVGVAHRRGVAEGLEERVGLQHLELGGGLLFDALRAGDGQVLHGELGRLGLAGPRLAADEDGLGAVVLGHAIVGVARHAEHVRFAEVAPLQVAQDRRVIVEAADLLEGVDGDKDLPC